MNDARDPDAGQFGIPMDESPPPPPPLLAYAQQPVRNLSSSSSAAFFSATQSPFFSPRSPSIDSALTKPDSLTPLSKPASLAGLFAAQSTERGCAGKAAVDRSECLLIETERSNSSVLSEDASRQVTPAAVVSRKERVRLAVDRSNAYKRVPASLSSSARLHWCDVYIGTHGRKLLLLRFTKWLRAELESEGIACFAADRARYRNSRSHDIAEKVMDSSTFGVVVITRKSFSNPYSIDEVNNFLDRKNLIPIYFDLAPDECLARDIIEKKGELWEKHGGELWAMYDGLEEDWRKAVDGLSRVEGWKLDAHTGCWRDCISSAVKLLGTRLGRRSVAEREKMRKERVEREEYPFPRNENFVGRKKELLELELMLFGDVNGDGEYEYFDLKMRQRRRRKSVKRRKNEDNVNPFELLQGREGIDVLAKGKEQAVWKESETEIEMQRHANSNSKSKGGDAKSMKSSKHEVRFARCKNNVLYGKGIACLSGESGIGKTELLLEYTYRYAQRYKMVLWVGGEARYFRQNYLSLCSLLGLEVTIELEKCRAKSFEEQEAEAFHRVRKELLRDIPYLVVIDNLESEKDWWDAVDIMELLPRFGGATHVLISTRLLRIRNIEPMKLSYLSSSEAMSLMVGGNETDYPVIELDALRTIEEKLGRLPMGLQIIGSILSEPDVSVTPCRLLETIERAPLRHISWGEREDVVLRRHPFFMQLLEICFSMFNQEDGPKKLATNMVWVSGWFAPSAISVTLLALAANELQERNSPIQSWKNCLGAFRHCWTSSHIQRSVAEAATMLVRFGIARNSNKPGWIYFHDIVRLYAQKRGVSRAPHGTVHAIRTRGMISLHSDHLWAACFLVFVFGNETAAVQLKVSDLVHFIRRIALPLAVHTFNAFSRCRAAMELLCLCTNALDLSEESLIPKVEKWLAKSSCWGASSDEEGSGENVWREVMLLKATVLETRAKLMLKSGKYDIGEDLCRMALDIRNVVCGPEHPDTISVQETLAKLVRFHTHTKGN